MKLIAGRAAIDLDFLLGKNGGHLNVNGIAGLGTKSTLLLHVNWLLLREAARQKRELPSDPARLSQLPEVATTAQLGYQELQIQGWTCLMAPARTPPEIDSITASIPHVMTPLRRQAMMGKHPAGPRASNDGRAGPTQRSSMPPVPKVIFARPGR